MLSFSFYFFIPPQSTCFLTGSSNSVCIPHSNTAGFSQSVTVLLMERMAGEMGNTAHLFHWRIEFSQCLRPLLGLQERVCGRRKRETTYGCNLKMLFLVALKCGKSKSLSLGRLWEGKFEIWERGKFRSPRGILSLSTKGGFWFSGAIGLLKVRNAYLH